MDQDDRVLTTPAPLASRESVRLATTGDQQCGCAAGNGSPPASFVYAIGNVEARFPTLSVEKEFVQATGSSDTAGWTDQQAFQSVLADPENRYLAREVCWVLSVRGMDTYLLHPRDPRDFDLLVDAIRPEPSPLDLDAVIGTMGPLAPPELCNGLIVPIVALDRIYSFDRDSLVRAVPIAPGLSDEQNAAAANQVLAMILQVADNAGATDEHRALNYLAMRYADIYTKTGEQFAADFSLSAVEVRASALSGARKVLNCIFSYTHRKTAFIEKMMVSVDVTERFPFLVGKLVAYYDRTSAL